MIATSTIARVLDARYQEIGISDCVTDAQIADHAQSLLRGDVLVMRRRKNGTIAARGWHCTESLNYVVRRSFSK